jgi:Short C-terminal domain
VLPALAVVLFALAVYLARGRRRRTLRTTGWCLVLIGVALLLIRRLAGDAIVDGLVRVPSNKPAVHDVWTIATSLLYDLAVAMIVYGLVFVVAAWIAGRTRPAIAIRKALSPSLRDHVAAPYLVVAGVLALVVLWGPTPAFRNIWWILVFVALLALGVTMLRRETAIEFPDIGPDQAIRDFSEQRGQAGAREASAQPAAAGRSVGGPAGATAPGAPGSGRVDSLERLAALRDRGAITEDEYRAEKTLVIKNGT